jgi:hypothetical protein
MTTHPHLMPRSIMRGAIPALHQYAFMAWWSVKAQGQLYFWYITWSVCSKYVSLYMTNSCVSNYMLQIYHKIRVQDYCTCFLLSQVFQLSTHWLITEARLIMPPSLPQAGGLPPQTLKYLKNRSNTFKVNIFNYSLLTSDVSNYGGN